MATMAEQRLVTLRHLLCAQCSTWASSRANARSAVACGGIRMRLMQAYNQVQTKSSAKVSCGAEQLCAGLKCGIEGSLHVV